MFIQFSSSGYTDVLYRKKKGQKRESHIENLKEMYKKGKKNIGRDRGERFHRKKVEN